MKNNNIIPNIKTLFFDFGGTIDTPGIHSRNIFWQLFQKNFSHINISREVFQDAYSYADETLISKDLALEKNLVSMNNIFIHLMEEKLALPSNALTLLAQEINSIQINNLQESYSFLLRLRTLNFRLAIVSNFSGNLKIILEEFKLLQFFEVVIDSYYEGVTKPDEKIFLLALDRMKAKPIHSLFVGDNLERDIIPANKLGMLSCQIDSSYNSPTNTIMPMPQYPNITIGKLHDLLTIIEASNFKITK